MKCTECHGDGRARMNGGESGLDFGPHPSKPCLSCSGAKPKNVRGRTERYEDAAGTPIVIGPADEVVKVTRTPLGSVTS